MSDFHFFQNLFADHTLSNPSLSNPLSPNEIVLSSLQSILDLKTGDVFTGEIVGVGGEEVQIKLENNTLLSARVEGQVQLTLGENLAFQVQSNENNKVVLKPVYTGQMQIHVGEAALKTAGIPVTKNNMQLTADMMENGLPIDKKNLTEVYREVLQHPDTDMHTIVALHKCNLPVNDTNIFVLQNTKELSTLLVDSLDDVVDEIWKSFDTIGTKEQEIQRDSVQGTLNYDSNVTNTEIPLHAENKSVAFMEQVLQIMVDENDTNQFQKLPEFFAQKETVTAQEVIAGLQNDSLSMKELVNVLSNQSVQMIPEKEKAVLFHDTTFSSKLNDYLKEQWLLTPETVSKNGEVEKLYKKIRSQVERLGELIEKEVSVEGTLPKSIQQIKQNLSFMNDVNQVFQYVQLPVKLMEHAACGELYVYTNKKKMTQKDGVITAYLHLDMDHLGPVNVHVSLDSGHQRVNTQFEIQENLMTFFHGYLGEFDKMIEALGYSVKSGITALHTSKNVMQQLEEQSGATNIMLSYQSFDMRA